MLSPPRETQRTPLAVCECIDVADARFDSGGNIYRREFEGNAGPRHAIAIHGPLPILIDIDDIKCKVSQTSFISLKGHSRRCE